MEFYKFALSAADRKSSVKFDDLETETSLFTTAINNCNSGVSFKRDGKKFILNEISTTNIMLTLSCVTPLANPTRTLSALSRELLRLDKVTQHLNSCIYNHTLFSTKMLENDPTEEITNKVISNSTLLKAMVDFLYSPVNDKKTEIFDAISNLLMDYIR